MSTVATLRVPLIGFSASFLSWRTDMQWSPDERQAELEELSPYGTIDTRYRVIRRTFPVFTAKSLDITTDYAAAQIVARKYLKAQGQAADLALSTNGAIAKFPVTIINSSATCRSGSIPGETGTGLIFGEWTLRRLNSKANLGDT